MTHLLVAGIVFKSSLLRTEWFFYLASFVAFNTIVFVGLSIGRFIYWPKNLFLVASNKEDAFSEKKGA